MLTQTSDIRRVFILRLNPGDDLLQCIREAVKESGIHNGVILNGLGSLSSYHFHVVETTNLPPGNVYSKGDGPFDIVAMSGLVINGRVHAHVTFSNVERAMAGHLEEGCHVLTFAMVVIADTPDADMAGWDTVGSL